MCLCLTNQNRQMSKAPTIRNRRSFVQIACIGFRQLKFTHLWRSENHLTESTRHETMDSKKKYLYDFQSLWVAFKRTRFAKNQQNIYRKYDLETWRLWLKLSKSETRLSTAIIVRHRFILFDLFLVSVEVESTHNWRHRPNRRQSQCKS